MTRKRGNTDEDTKEFSAKLSEIVDPIKSGAQSVFVKREGDMSWGEFSQKREAATRNAVVVGKKGILLRVGKDGNKTAVAKKEVVKPTKEELSVNVVGAVLSGPKKGSKIHVLSPEEVEKFKARSGGFVAEGEVRG